MLGKPQNSKIFCEPETIHCKKANEYFLKTIPFYLEDDSHEEFNSNGGKLTFALQVIKN